MRLWEADRWSGEKGRSTRKGIQENGRKGKKKKNNE